MANEEILSLSNGLYRNIVAGTNLPEAVAAVKASLSEQTGKTRISIEHVLSTAACRAFRERDEEIVDQLLSELGESKDQYPFEFLIRSLVKAGAYQGVWKALQRFESVLTPDFIAKQKVWACKKMIEIKDASGILYKLLEAYPQDDVLGCHVIYYRALTMRAKGREDDAQKKAEQINPTDPATCLPLAWELHRNNFPQKAYEMMKRVTDPNALINLGKALLEQGYAREAATILRPGLQKGVKAYEVEQGVVGFDLAGIILYADCARQDSSLEGNFLSLIDEYERQGMLPEPYCVALRAYLKKGRASNRKILRVPNDMLDDDGTARSRFFTNPHDILRSTPLNRVADRVIGKDLKPLI